MTIDDIIGKILRRDFDEPLDVIAFADNNSSRSTVCCANGRYFRLGNSSRLDACFREAYVLKMINEKAPHLPVPKLLSHGSIDDIPYTVTSAIAGEPASKARPDPYTIGKQIGRFYSELHKIDSPGCGYPSIEGKYFDGCWRELVHSRILTAYKLINGFLTSEVRNKIMHIFISTPLEKRLMKILHHDPHAGNFIVKDNTLAGVVDWESFTGGDPQSDYAFLIHGSSEPFQAGILEAISENLDTEFSRRSVLYVATDYLCQLALMKKDNHLRQRLLDEINNVLKPVKPGIRYYDFVYDRD